MLIILCSFVNVVVILLGFLTPFFVNLIADANYQSFENSGDHGAVVSALGQILMALFMVWRFFFPYNYLQGS
jgi:hypothetical protein